MIDDVDLHELIPPKLSELSLEVGQIIQLDRIYFDFDKWDLLPASYEQLKELLDLLEYYPSMKIAIHGHTDSHGTDQYNVELSDKRSKSVMDYLLENGIASDRLEAAGFGESKPIDSNNTDNGRQMNRRVEFVVLQLDENITVDEYNPDN